MIELAPLDMWQIQNLLPPDVTAAQARMVARESRGNPFWALQISAGLGAADSQLPRLARTLTDRLSRMLSADAADALAVVAAAGRIGVAETLAVLDHIDDPAAAVDATVLTGVVVETAGRLSAAHPLIGAAAVESLPPGRSGRELTGTERRVAELIAAGATNRDAAAELFVSVRTIETHVAAIYRKLGVRSRAELARRLPPSPTTTS
ncbi:MAG TPA: helix-turn-helix transcriptional regulator [Streptosporangiaceae bacterium]